MVGLKVCCDTSGLIAMTAREPTWRAHADWLDDHAGERVLSTLGWGELVDVTARRLRQGKLIDERAPDVLAATRATFAEWVWVDLVSSDVDVGTSYLIRNMMRGLKLPDAIHLAICQRIGAALLTGDRQQAAAAAEMSIPSHLILPSSET